MALMVYQKKSAIEECNEMSHGFLENLFVVGDRSRAFRSGSLE